jgi:hypothetical protein
MYGTNKKIIPVTVALLAWILLLLLLSYNGFFADFSQFPPRPAIILLLPLPLILFYAFSKSGSRFLQNIPAHWLIYMQSFRIAVELLLAIGFINGMLPVQMTFEGMNFDIVSGILALPVGYLVAKKKAISRKMAFGYNVIGLLLLINILVIAVLSMPTPIRYFMNEPSNTLVAEFPYILLPGVLVPIAYTMHIFSLRKLYLERRSVTCQQPYNPSTSGV